MLLIISHFGQTNIVSKGKEVLEENNEIRGNFLFPASYAFHQRKHNTAELENKLTTEASSSD